MGFSTLSANGSKEHIHKRSTVRRHTGADKARPYYNGLNGLRAVAVGIVIIHHAGAAYPRSGSLGVDIFFVLSGFLITSILSTEYARISTISFKNFYARRFLRLAPCLFMVCGFYALLDIAVDGKIAYKTLLVVLTYTANWARAIYDMNLFSLSHTWSLAAEEQFYLVWPLAILLLERSVKSTMVKAVTLLCVALAAAAYRASVIGDFPSERIHYGLDTHMDGLILGAALSYGVSYLRSQNGLSTLGSKVLGRVAVPVGIVALLVMLGFTWDTPWMERYGTTLGAFVAAAMILDIVLGRHSLIRRAMEIKPAQFTGKISYGLYLWHLPIFAAANRFFAGVPLSVTALPKIGLSFLVASVSYFFVERYFLQLKHRFESPSGISATGPGI